MADLATLQRRFYQLVTSGAGVVEPGLIAGPPRLGVYADMYLARLHDTLADDYPKLRASLGATAFHELVASYVRARPPTSFTLRDAGVELPAFLATQSAAPWAADLATLERARVEVFDAADAIPLSRADLANVPAEEFAELRLSWVPTSAIIALAWTVDELWSAIEDELAIVDPLPAPRVVLVWRRETHVIHRTLDVDEAALAPLVTGGATIAQLSSALADQTDAPEVRIVELLARWIDAEMLATSPRDRA